MSPIVFMSFRNLARNRRRTLLAMGAVIVGLCALTILRGFVNSVQKAQLETTLFGTTGMLQIHRSGYLKNILSNPLELAFSDTPQLRERILSQPNVVALSPRLQFSGSISATEVISDISSLASSEPKTTFLAANAIDPALDRKVLPQLYDWITSGQMFPDADSPALVVHREIAGPLGIDDVEKNINQPKDLWPVVLAPDKEGSLSGDAFQITGLMGSAVPTDKRLALAPLKVVQRLLKMDNQVTEYIVRLDGEEKSEAVQAQLQIVLGDEFEVSRWDEIVPFIKDLLSNVSQIFGFITVVFLIVIMLGIVNSMFMNVFERVREIGTMMALGIRRKSILSLFIIEGAFLGAVGALVGLAVGIFIVHLGALTGIPINAPGSAIKFVLRPFVSFDYIVSSFLMTTLGAALVSVWPAWRASRLRPVEALSAV